VSGRRLVRALDLAGDADLIAAYETWHASNAVWPEVVAHIRAQGILDMEIWRRGSRLTMIMEVTDDFPREVPEPPKIAEWEELMWRFQKPLPDAAPGEKWVEMTRIFALVEQGRQP
jgi:L-rhamnose mutarotase